MLSLGIGIGLPFNGGWVGAATPIIPLVAPTGAWDGSAPLSPFLGLTGLGYHNNFSSTGGFTASMTRKPIVATDDMADVKVGFALFTMQPTDTAEGVDATPGNTYAVRASIEYNGAIVAQLTFPNHATGDASTGQAVSGSGVQIIESDLCALGATIPAGATFWVRFYSTGPTMFYTGSPANWNTDTANGECFNFNNSPIDLTASTGTFANSNAGLTQSPIYVACTKTSPSVAIVGDSKAAGGCGGSNIDVFSLPGHRGGILRGLPTNMGYYAAGTAGTQATSWEATAANRKHLLKYCSSVVWEHAVNDLNASVTASQLIAHKQALITALAAEGCFSAGVKHIWATCEPYTTGTFTSTAGQTVGASNSQRTSFNSLLRAGGISQCDGILDVAAQVEATGADAGKWLANYTSDGLNENVTGYDAVVAWLSAGAGPIFAQAGPGGFAPVDPPRTTAKPALKWLDVSGQLLTSNTVIGVDADALGGVSKVTFWVGGTAQDVTSTAVYSDTDANGNPRLRYGYFINLDVVAAYTARPSGTLTVYATAVPADGTMQNRVLGPFTVYPRALTFTDPTDGWDKTLGTSGANFTDYQTAVADFQTSGKKYGRLTVTTSGVFEMGSFVAEYTGHTGFFELTHKPGVTATFRKGSGFNPMGAFTGGSWDVPWWWWPSVSRIHFKGQGIVIDWINTNSIRSLNGADGAYWFDGCTHTNSIGTRDSTYWNGAPHPGMFFDIAANGTGLAAHFTDCTISYVDISCRIGLFHRNKVLNPKTGRFGNNAANIIGNYVRGADPSYFRTGANVFSATYTGAGTTATIERSGNNFLLKVNGSTTHTIAISTADNYDSTSDHAFWPQDIVDTINGYGDGWAATRLDNTWRASLVTGDGTNDVAPINAKGVSATLLAWNPVHSEILEQGFNCPPDNVMMRGNIFRDSFYATSFFGQVPNDSLILDNVFHSATISADDSRFHAGHVVFRNNFLHTGYTNDVGDCDSYSEFRNNIFYRDTAVSAAYPAWVNNLVATGQTPGGPHDSGNVAISQANILACFTNLTNGDYRPTGAALSNLRAYSLPNYDGRLAQRAASDAPGAWKAGGSAPSWPF